MPRATASGTISFGLVTIPVKIYSATQSKSPSFRLLHAKDKARLRQQYICTACDGVVERDDMVRGYEYAKGQYAVLTDEELKSIETQSDQTIAIEEFVPISTVDPIYFESSRYLGPDKGGARAYRLLCDAMSEAGRAAVATFSSRGRNQLVLLRPSDKTIVLHALYYADEVRDAGEIDFGEVPPAKPAEANLAVKLIDELSQERFDPNAHQDESRQAVLQLVERKVEGKEVVIAEAPQSKAQVIDLMEALRQSLGKSRRAEAAQDEGKKPARAERAKAAEPSPRRAGSEATAPKPPVRAMRDAAEAKPAKRSRAAK